MPGEVLDRLREAVVIRPGDTLLVRVVPNIPSEAVREMKDQLTENLPAGVRVLVVGCEQLAVVRGDDD